MCVCVCVRACVRACTRACVCMLMMTTTIIAPLWRKREKAGARNEADTLRNRLLDLISDGEQEQGEANKHNHNNRLNEVNSWIKYLI